MQYQVNEIFQSIQGEGPFAGAPANFIRLSGCNLKCTFCDTKHTDFEHYDLDDIIDNVSPMYPLVVITGGEPTLQDLVPLLKMLHAYNYNIQVETNGTHFDPHFHECPNVSWVISPKSGANIHIGWTSDSLNIYWKFLVDVTTSPDRLPKHDNVYLQPITVRTFNSLKSIRNRTKAVELCMLTGAKLSLQTQKLLDIR